MSRSNLFPIGVLVCFILLGAATISFSIGCPDCFFNNDAPMNGPASADGRRTISIKIDLTEHHKGCKSDPRACELMH